MDDGSDPDSGADTQAMPVQPPPSWVLGGRYRVIDRIGSGGMAEVFRAHDELLNRDVAVKVFRTPVDEPGNSASLERRQRELRALAQLSHPNLIALFDGSITDGGPSFLVMELVVGQDLAHRLTEGPLDEAQARMVGAQIADALAFVHARGMVHRDVKPANILLGVDGSTTDPGAMRARLSDFGIVRMIDNARLTAVAFTLGTASYLAPEQAVGANVDAAADIYSLGLVLIEALSGVRSFDGPQHEAVAARLARSPDIPIGLPQPWPGLLAAMTATDPAVRPTAAQVATSLRSAVAPAVPPAVPAAVPLVGPIVVPPIGGPPEADDTRSIAALADEPLVDEPPAYDHKARNGVALIVAALAFVAVITAAGILIFQPNPDGGSPTTSQSASASAGESANASTTRESTPRTPTTSASVSRTASSSAPSSSATSTSASASSSGSASSASASSHSAPSSAPASTTTTSSVAKTASATSTASPKTTSTTSAGARAAGTEAPKP